MQRYTLLVSKPTQSQPHKAPEKPQTSAESIVTNNLFNALKNGLTAKDILNNYFGISDKNIDKNGAQFILDNAPENVDAAAVYILQLFLKSQKPTLREFFDGFYQLLWKNRFYELEEHFEKIFPKELLLSAIDAICEPVNTIENVVAKFVEPICKVEMPTVDVKKLYEKFELHTSPVGTFFARKLFTPGIKAIETKAAEHMFQALKKGFDEEEAFNEHLSRFARTTTQEDVKHFYRDLESFTPLTSAQNCLLQAFLASTANNLGEYMDHLYATVLEEKITKLMAHFTAIVNARMRYASHKGLQLNDSLEKIMQLLLGENPEFHDLHLKAFLILFSYEDHPTQTLEDFIRDQIKHHFIAKTKEYLKALIQGSKLASASLNNTEYFNLIYDNAFNDIARESTVSDISDYLNATPNPNFRIFLNAFLSSNHPTVEAFVKSLYEEIRNPKQAPQPEKWHMAPPKDYERPRYR